MIFSAFERMVAMRYLRARRQEGFISVIAGFSFLGIALGVATLIVVMAVMNGFRGELLGRVLGLNGHLNVYAAENGPLHDFDALAGTVRAVPGVVRATPLVEGQALITVRGVASGAMVRGVRPDDFKGRPTLARNIIRGTADAFAEDYVAIGIRMAQRLGLTVGDQITLIAPQGDVAAFGTSPRMRSFPIGAIFATNMFEYDNSFIFMPLEPAQAFFNLGDGVSALELFVADPLRMDDVRAAVAAAAGPGHRVMGWEQANASLFTALKIERTVMFLILTLIIIVAAFNIISSLMMLVKEKGRDVAILRTMGATRGMIMRVFFLSGASVGVVGTLAGLGLGLAIAGNMETVGQVVGRLSGGGFSAEVAFLSHLPARVDWGEVVVVVVMGLTLSMAATVYPSWRAARLDPVEALRYE